MQQAAPGWYTDPYDPSVERIWDGTVWTTETRTIAPPAPVPAWRPPPAWNPQAPTWVPPTEPPPETTHRARGAAATPAVGLWIVVGAFALAAVSFVAGYAVHRPTGARPASVPLGQNSATGTQRANVDVPGPTAPPGVDTAGVIAEKNLDLAASVARSYMRARPGAEITQQGLEDTDGSFSFDLPGTPIGDPGTVGQAVISTAIDHLPGAPRRVVFALPGMSACYYVSVAEGSATRYGVARGADAVSHCFVSEQAGNVPQVRPETEWSTHWPAPTS